MHDDEVLDPDFILDTTLHLHHKVNKYKCVLKTLYQICLVLYVAISKGTLILKIRGSEAEGI